MVFGKMSVWMCVCACVRACVRVCVRACVRVCVCACVCMGVYAWILASTESILSGQVSFSLFFFV